MSVSPKYRSNFSVTDILSPLDETAASLLQQAPLKPLKSYSENDHQSASPNQCGNGNSSYLLLQSTTTPSANNSSLLVNDISGITDANSHQQPPNSSDNNNQLHKSSQGMSVPVSTPFGVHHHQLGMHSSHPSTPHSGGHHTTSVSSAFSSSAAAAAQYVNGAGELSAASAYAMPGDVRSAPAPWYSTSTSDPRFATDYTLSTGKSKYSLYFKTNFRVLVDINFKNFISFS